MMHKILLGQGGGRLKRLRVCPVFNFQIILVFLIAVLYRRGFIRFLFQTMASRRMTVQATAPLSRLGGFRKYLEVPQREVANRTGKVGVVTEQEWNPLTISPRIGVLL
jgi:hypothetical protein